MTKEDRVETITTVFNNRSQVINVKQFEYLSGTIAA